MGSICLLIFLCVISSVCSRIILFYIVQAGTNIERANRVKKSHRYSWDMLFMTYVKKYAGDWKWLYIGCQISFGLSILNGICGTLFRQNIFTCILAQSVVTVLTAFALLTDPGASKSEYNEYIIESSQKKYKNQKQDWNRGQQTGRLLDKMYDNLQRMIDCNHARLIFQYPISTNQLDWVYYELVWIRGEYQKKNLYFKDSDALIFWIFPDKYMHAYREAKRENKRDNGLLYVPDNYLLNIISIYESCRAETGFPETTIPNLLENLNYIEDILYDLKRFKANNMSEYLAQSIQNIREDIALLRVNIPTKKELPNGHYCE